MRIARFKVGEKIAYGSLEGDLLKEIQGSIYDQFVVTDVSYRLDEVELLVPCTPSKMLAMALNYPSHLSSFKAPSQPEIFLKTPSALLPPGGTIALPREAGRVDYEGELVVVMKKKAKHVSPEEALDYVLGYTCGNDVSAREWQKKDMQWWRAKSSDTFAPLGPCIATDLDPANLGLELRLNGEVKQRTNTSQLIFDVSTIISFASRVMTLEPGDAIFTGTPGTPEPLKDGDVVEVEIEGIGVLKNLVSSR